MPSLPVAGKNLMAVMSFQKFPNCRKGELQSYIGKTLVIYSLEKHFMACARHWGFRLRSYSSVQEPQMITLESRIRRCFSQKFP